MQAAMFMVLDSSYGLKENTAIQGMFGQTSLSGHFKSRAVLLNTSCFWPNLR